MNIAWINFLKFVFSGQTICFSDESNDIVFLPTVIRFPI